MRKDRKHSENDVRYMLRETEDSVSSSLRGCQTNLSSHQSCSVTLRQLSTCALCIYSTRHYIMAHHCQLSTFDITGCPCSASPSAKGPWTCNCRSVTNTSVSLQISFFYFCGRCIIFRDESFAHGLLICSHR